MSIAYNVKVANEAHEGNMSAKNMLTGYEVVTMSYERRTKLAARQFFQTLSGAHACRKGLETKIRNITHIYDLRLRSRVV